MNFQEFLDGSGRISRKDWLVWIIVAGIISAILSWLFGRDDGDLNWIGAIISILPFVVGVFLGIKRLHDFDKSGWFMLLGLIPFVNFIFAIALLVWPGNPGDNRFGAPNSGTPFQMLHA